MKKVPSPCNFVCTMDRTTGLCIGCLRTMDEITGWQGYSEAQKQAVLDRVAKRKHKRDEA